MQRVWRCHRSIEAQQVFCLQQGCSLSASFEVPIADSAPARVSATDTAASHTVAYQNIKHRIQGGWSAWVVDVQYHHNNYTQSLGYLTSTRECPQHFTTSANGSSNGHVYQRQVGAHPWSLQQLRFNTKSSAAQKSKATSVKPKTEQQATPVPHDQQSLQLRCVGDQVVAPNVVLNKYRIPALWKAVQSTLGRPLGGRHKTATDEQKQCAYQLLSQDACFVWAHEIVTRLREAGHGVYFVGGWVRDAMLGRPSKDIDIATSANVATELPRIFPRMRIVQLQRSTARMESGGMSLEVTQYKGPRKEADLDSLYFDACHRDFTINSLYYDPIEHEVLDFLHGIEHLNKRVLDLPPYPLGGRNMPSPVIAADPLRVLRAVRFAAGLGCSITEGLKDQINRHVHRCCFEQGLGGVGNRRLIRELSKVCNLPAEHVATAFELMAGFSILPTLFPELVHVEPEICKALQEFLTQETTTNSRSDDNDVKQITLPVSPAMRVLMLVNPTQGETTLQIINAVIARMESLVQGVWDRNVWETGRKVAELLQEATKPTSSHEIMAVTGKKGKPEHKTARLDVAAHRVTVDARAQEWFSIIDSQEFRHYDAWITAWVTRNDQEIWHHACKALRESPRHKRYPFDLDTAA